MDKKEKKNTKIYARMTSIAIQMGVVIGGFTWLGTFLDEKQMLKTPVWTIVLSLIGVGISMYLVFKEIKDLNSDD